MVDVADGVNVSVDVNIAVMGRKTSDRFAGMTFNAGWFGMCTSGGEPQ